MEKRDYSQTHLFTRYFLVTFISILFFVAALNIFVDPYRFFNISNIEGFNKKRVLYSVHDRVYKEMEVRRMKPDCTVHGSSRVLYGIEPKQEYWKECKTVYNLGLSAAHIDEIGKFIMYADRIRQQKTVLVGLDFFGFNVNSIQSTGFEEERLLSGYNHYSDIKFLSYYFSKKTLFDSAKTVSRQKEPYSPDIVMGFDSFNHARGVIKRTSYRNFFIEQISAYTPGNLVNWKEFSYSNNDINLLKEFKNIVHYAKKRGFHLVLFFAPLNYISYDLLERSELFDSYFQWKNDVIDTLRKADAIRIELWDFSDINYITSVDLFSDEEKTEKYYWELSHYTNKVGLLIQEVALSGHPVGDFGKKVDMQYLSRDRESTISKLRELALRNIKMKEEIDRIVERQNNAF